MKKVITGLDQLVSNFSIQTKYKGNVALLCHNASMTSDYTHAALKFFEIFGTRFIKLFGPQHGFSSDAQDNMIETDHYIHPYFNIPVYSLYSETRIPTDDMLSEINHLFIDMQDVGCRMYTYIYTLTLILEKCAEKEIEIIILDRPNPINGVTIEGNILDMEYQSFIGRHPLPVRHGLTMAEVALMHQKNWVKLKANVRVIKMKHWQREMYFKDTGLPWVSPSPNLARAESACTFPSIVLFEGTNLSEGRGTTQALEIFGHPKIDAFSFWQKHLKQAVACSGLEGFMLRPITFLPTFQKQADMVCGGFQLHITNKKTFQPWRTGQFLMREMYHYLGADFNWNEPPYEYNYTKMPIDIINGSDQLRHWIIANEPLKALDTLENLREYKKLFNDIKIY